MSHDLDDFSDFDNEDLTILEELLQKVEADETRHFIIADIEDVEAPRGLRLPASPTRLLNSQANGAIRREEVPEAAPESAPTTALESAPEVAEPDTRSPLERFRRPPKKAFSVTDLVSPSWCELQYFYTLSRHGRKRRTPAMKQGTQVHQALEEELHITVPVDVPTKEDGWGLRIWNIIQGLRTLQQTGRTRELEVWGTVGGELVNGIIDEVSYECPDSNLEEKPTSHKKSAHEVPEHQTSIKDILSTAAKRENGKSLSDALLPKPQSKKIYITDIKTRQSKSLPTPNAMKPTILQLHLYHHMLENMAQGNFALERLAERYSFDVNQTFSDSFIAQVGSLNQELETPTSSTSEDSMVLLLRYNKLTDLWDFMIGQMKQAFLLPAENIPMSTPQSLVDLPVPENQPTRLSPILTVEYLSAWYQHRPGETTGQHSLGRKSFVFDAEYLKNYLEDSLAWWHGEREAKGVELQEAWKCRHCDFRNDCEWIHSRDSEALNEALARKSLRQEAFKPETSHV